MRKYTLLIALFCFAAGRLAAQGNTLVFNQVLTFANSNITVSPYVIGSVPAGKVWKIEYMGSYKTSYPNSFVINTGTTECDFGVFSYGTPTSNATPHGPIWLKAGDVIKVLMGTITNPITYFISVIEFNVVPL
jgi:hypothetical protein